jgi:hypothetical protein
MGVTQELPLSGMTNGRAPMKIRSLIAFVIAIGLVAVGCSSSSEGPAATPVTTSTTQSVDKESIVQEFVDRRSDGRIVESLALATSDVSETYIERIKGLAAWNFRSEQAGPCKETSVNMFHCPMLEYTDFHIAAGMSPWTNNMLVTVNDEGVITDTNHRLVEFHEVRVFNAEFQRWLEATHPAEADSMNGAVMTLSFTEDDALIALRFVDEFVVFQSEG